MGGGRIITDPGGGGGGGSGAALSGSCIMLDGLTIRPGVNIVFDVSSEAKIAVIRGTGGAAGPHTHPEGDIVGLTASLAGKAALAHVHAQSEVTDLVAALASREATANKGTANGYAGLDATGKVPAAQLPVSGSDPWTYIKLVSDFTTTSATAVDVAGLGFAPAASTDYEFRAMLMVRTNTATANPRVGLAWATGMADGAAQIIQSQAATGTPLFASGNPAASLLVAVGGLPNTTQSWPVSVRGIVRAGASPSGNVRIQMASETAGTTVTMKAGSFLARRAV